nr:uncharacterized mitochondrial protein AtMg00810-like [Tanacetum cinerariifolium]
MEGLGHNLILVSQFCDSDLEVAFRKHTCFVSNLEGVDLLSGSRGTNLYSLSIEDMMASSPICLLSKATKTKLWLWHRHLFHLNFGALNHLARNGLISQSSRGIFLNQSKYALESLKKYGMESCNPVDTPMVKKSKLDEDTQGKAVDPTHYRGMFGTLMYLTSSRPDLDSLRMKNVNNSMGSRSQNYDSNGSQEVDLELRLSL